MHRLTHNAQRWRQRCAPLPLAVLRVMWSALWELWQWLQLLLQETQPLLPLPQPPPPMVLEAAPPLMPLAVLDVAQQQSSRCHGGYGPKR